MTVVGSQLFLEVTVEDSPNLFEAVHQAVEQADKIGYFDWLLDSALRLEAHTWLVRFSEITPASNVQQDIDR